ncbi:MAG TPA: TraB/GumN family protein [Allosphingosinicella sp.]|nr:TraB/GumN family protein [Allosphingosinicella sp.]
MRGKSLFRLATAFAGFALIGAAPVPHPAPAAAHGHPAIWKLADKDTTIYLFGTFHLLPQGENWRTPAFDKALASSDELVMEIPNIDDANALAQSMLKLAVQPGLPPLVERVPPEKRAGLKAMIAESGIPEPVLDRMKTWAAALLLDAVIFKRLHLDPNAGVEETLIGPWRKSGKPLEGLETAEQQFGLFDHLSDSAQRAFLIDEVDELDKAKPEFDAMIRAWISGDVAGIARTFNDDMKDSPELRKALLVDRNARWADWLKARMAKPGTLFVAVGAGHLAGPESVEAMLATRGVKVTRVQ